MTEHSEDISNVAVAVIGMAGRFPGAGSISEYWRLLRDGREGIHFFSKEELLQAGMLPSMIEHPAFVPAKGYLKDAEQFETELFNYHPRDAQVIDPQQRLLLECCWETLEASGCNPARYTGAIGVFVGVSMNSWLNQLQAVPEIIEKAGWYQLMISNDKDYAATRVSYQLDLRGPSITIQTACSTSLVAVAQACQSIASGECDMALAGAASLAFPRKAGYFYEEGMILSPDGHCRTFDAQAQGTVPGEGVGVVALKRLEDALADGDHIEAVIRGWAVNNDGSNKVGFTAPSIDGQAEVITAAQMLAGISADTIEYIEAHGTATPLGDPIEVAALTDAFASQTSRKQFCRIGSVKSNLGHLDTAAGIAGFIKTVLALKHRQIPPSLHYTAPNPEIDFENSPFHVITRLTPWEPTESPRRAGVSSFGIGGTNCHLVLEEAPATTPAVMAPTPQILPFSGASLNATEQIQQHLADALEEDHLSLADVAFTLQTGRTEHRNRRVLVCDNVKSAGNNLRSTGASQVIAGHAPEQTPPVVFMFPGQGSQFLGMGQGLYDTSESFREHYDQCTDIVLETSGWDLRKRVETRLDDPGAAILLDETATTQPALFATSYSLARLLMSWGIEPSAMIGHSIGEFVAACLAGVMTLEDAMRVVVKRGELMQKTDPGAMLAVAWEGAAAIEGFLNGRAEIAAINAPGSIVLSGRKHAIVELKTELEKRSIQVSLLRTSQAFHSSLMDTILDEFHQFIGRISLHPPNKPFISTVTGTWITQEEATDPGYWTKGIRQPVRFEDAVRCVCSQVDRSVFLEVGPGRSLQTLARKILGVESDSTTLSCLRSPDSNRSDDWTVLETIGRLWTNGQPIHWERIHGAHQRKRVLLPTYPFQRRDFSISKSTQPSHPFTVASQISKQPLSRWFYSPSWRRQEQISSVAANPLVATGWLVFCDADGVGRELGDRLSQQGFDVNYIQSGEEFQQISENEFVLNPRLYGNYSQLLNTLSGANRRVDRILHCWTMCPGSAFAFELNQDLGFYSLLFLSQALGRRAVTDSVRIDVVSCEVQDVLGTETLCPAKATLRAPLLVIPQEYPHISCQHMDLDIEDIDRHRNWIVQSVLEELSYDNPGGETVLRGQTRWVRSFESLALPDVEKVKPEAEGVWIVIGGFGQIGLTIASWIAYSKKAPVILVSRSETPDSGEWDTWLQDHDAADPTSQRILAAKQLMDAGIAVSCESADVSDEPALRQVAERAVQRHGSIEGIVHSAGVVDNRIIHYTSPADCAKQFRAKVAGIEALAKLVDEFSVPICLVNSSLSSVLGGLGFCGYTASNVYLDAYLRLQNRQGKTRWIGVNWDGWLFPDIAEIMKDDPALQLTLTPDEGFTCLERIAGTTGLNQVVVSTGDLNKRLEAWVFRQQIEQFISGEDNSDSQSQHPRPGNLSSVYVAPNNDTEKIVVGVWEELLGIEGIGANDNYIELGGHSLLAGQIIGRLRDRLKTPISIRSLFEFPTVSELSLHVEAVRLTFDDGDDDSSSEERTEVEF
jgi:acyl transferase domain-containing protein/acyl carrier protein